MKEISFKVGRNKIFQFVNSEVGELISPDKVIQSWDNSLKYIEGNQLNNVLGFRTPQLGALFAIKAHWTVSKLPATVVMPTGTGKTETMIATILSEKCQKVLVIVPSNLLRKQTAEKCMSFGVLKDFGLVKKEALNPAVGILTTTPSDLNELKEIIEKSNIIVTTMRLLSGFPDEYINSLIKSCTELFIDEAHHIAAVTWKRIKIGFSEKKILQFTATPFREDGKKVDGKIIYNFPLFLAQQQGYFKPIQFQGLMEFDNTKADFAIAQTAVNTLKNDIEKGYNQHTILVRASSKKQAEYLHKEIYNKYFQEYNPVLIISDIPKKDKDKALQQIKENKSKILICVDMFGEGIDIPSLKIAAIHDKYKSLPITLQFIGRFARSQKELGNATVIANIANEDINESIEELYSQDSDWNKMLVEMSSSAIDKEVDMQELLKEFTDLGINDISITNLRPKVSMIGYETTCERWKWKDWTSAFNIDKCAFSKNDEKNVIIIIEMDESKIDWSADKRVNNVNYHLHLVYWNKTKKMAYVNSTDKSKSDRLIEAILPGSQRVTGETVFRCLSNINQLKLGTVGLKCAIDGPVRFKMFAGLDIKEGISESTKANSTKSNLFGIGYDGNGKVSIGCSYKGTIWSRWVESIDYWMKWCDKTADKLLDDKINISDIFEGTLIPEIVQQRPNIVPISIEWPDELIINNEEKVRIKSNFDSEPLYNVDISLLTDNDKDPLRFFVESPIFREEYELVLNENKAHYKCIHPQNISISMGNKEMPLVEFFNENPPIIRFADQSILELNLYTKLNIKNRVLFDEKDIQKWDWSNTNIQIESQTENKIKESIQYNVISKLKQESCYNIIFDDDGRGEIADLIAIKDLDNEISIELYHCKFSKDSTPGSRVEDLYVVCGQAQKSIYWKQDGKALINRMIKREVRRTSLGGISRLELGDINKLMTIKNKISKMGFNLSVYIVQPGIDSLKMSDSVNELLCCTKNYCLETYGVRVNLISS